MKKALLLILLLGMMTAVYSQSQRLVLLEEFTSSTCGPCAGVNPGFHTWQVQNPDKFTSIYYHVNWPSPGDPMNVANPGENATRVSYYGVTYVPESNLDGNYYNGSASGWNMNTVNARWAMPSPFEIKVQHQLSAGLDSVYSNMLVKCTEAVSGNLVAHNVIIEKWIHFNSPPGSNGEKDFYNAMKKMLPNANGTTLAASWVPGDYVLLEGSWKFGVVYDPNQIAAVGFVQDKSTKEVFQTANSATDVLVMPYTTDLQSTEVQNVPASTCLNHIAPVIKVRNNGNDAITSMTIKYRVNDGDWHTYDWSGNLPMMKKASVALPDFIYPMLPQNTLTLYTTNPNNSADQYPKNDTLRYSFKMAPSTGNSLTLTLHTDLAPQETTWKITNTLGTVMASGGPYTQSNQVLQVPITLPPASGDCMTFTIYDSGGNGMCCSNGSGAYQLSSGSIVVKQGGTFTDFEATQFYTVQIGQPEPIQAGSFSIYPNPIEGSAKISFPMATSGPASVSIYSALGQVVSTTDLGTFDSGQHETVLDVHTLAPGMYILKMNTGTTVYSRKVTVVR